MLCIDLHMLNIWVWQRNSQKLLQSTSAFNSWSASIATRSTTFHWRHGCRRQYKLFRANVINIKNLRLSYSV